VHSRTDRVQTSTGRCFAHGRLPFERWPTKSHAAALDLLTTRGITADDRARLAARVRSIQRVSAASSASEPVTPSLAPVADDPREALYVWFSEWSEIARAVTPRRADQIKLGLASPRRARAAATEETDEEGDDEDEATDEADAPAAVAAPAAKRAPAKPVSRGTPSSAPSPA